jgi:DNA-binding NarL/FixJ family response regulator
LLIKVLVVDDHVLIRDALTDLFAATVDIEVVGQCADGMEVAAAVERTRPDVILMDLQMPRMDGLAATRDVLDRHAGARVVILTGGLTPATVTEAKAAGAVGYLLKEDSGAGLPDKVRAVAAGGTAWHPHALALIGDDGESARDLPLLTIGCHYVDAAPRRFRDR